MIKNILKTVLGIIIVIVFVSVSVIYAPKFLGMLPIGVIIALFLCIVTPIGWIIGQSIFKSK